MTSTTFPIDLLRSDLCAIVQALDSGAITSEQLVRECIRRINDNNVKGLGLRAVSQMVTESDCLAAARDADETRLHDRKGLLHGIPVLIKESIGTGPSLGLRTTGGSPALADSLPHEDAPVVKSLLEAGMIILGKTNMTALSNHYQDGIPNGWSPLGGQVRSPFGVDVDPGGSSTGSAVALAAGWIPAAIGAETMGSITCPADFNGLWGMKPTPGSIPNQGVVPINLRFDTIGPFGKTVEDVACLLDVLISGSSFRSGLTTAKPGLSIGVSSVGLEDITAEEKLLFSQATQCLSSIITAKDIEVPLHRRALHDGCGQTIMTQGLEVAWATYLRGVDSPMNSLQDVVNWHSDHPSESFHPAHPGQSCFIAALEPQSESRLAQVHSVASQLKSNFEALMRSECLDAIMYPSVGSGPILSTLADLPICAAPYAMKEDGSLFGVTFVARAGAEATLLQVMKACEKAFPGRHVPDV